MKKEQGSLAINSENIFPIIKKWLYSDHDIFIRELVSNGCDAITKLKKLEMIGETALPDDYKEKVEVYVNAEEKTIRFVDNGIGMTEDEVKEYINQIAFSGATAFLEKYKDKSSEDQIIGHFGLGFYSAFMVADRVEINTCSYLEGEQAIHWESECGTEFEMSDSDKDTVGTEIILHLNEDSYEFSNEYRVREVLEKYCSFMPVEIFLTNENAEPQYETIPSEEVTEDDTVIEEIVEEPKAAEKDGEEGEEGENEEKKEPVKKTKILKRPVPINDTHPLWTKHPNECTEEEYKEFYRKVFQDYKEPLFWIHLNMDYPFNLKGILYFPKVNLEYENAEGIIKLYNNQVFIADNIKEVIPEFLMLLKGVIDCPDLPLNVSRSALQNDGFVTKIADYITKKVADKLSGMCKTDRENFEKYWDDISPFIKYGCLKDEKFKSKMKDYILFKDLDDNYMTMKEYLENVDVPEAEVVEKGEEENDSEPQEPPKTVIYYVTDKKQQSQYINMFREENKNAFVLTHNIDQPFISNLEMGEDNIKFQRIDAQVTEDFVEEMSEEEIKEKKDALTEIFRKALGKENLDVRVEKMKNEKIASMITMSEETRRMQDMMKMYAMNGMGAMGDFGGETLVLNVANPLVQYVENHKDGDKTDLFCKQLYDLAMLGHKPLEPEAMTEFVLRSNEIMELLAEK
ncbi:MAG: molecular chaperone HtpG [Clostridiales bacterium]|nr:molecular chaperone HtpG [Eubacterium sp.]MDD5994718.1 molecular chaperone HtpG [Clostridiales bacterium]MDD7350005.1 molecular chaperone HtpG [Clostridiales bacterium]